MNILLLNMSPVPAVGASWPSLIPWSGAGMTVTLCWPGRATLTHVGARLVTGGHCSHKSSFTVPHWAPSRPCPGCPCLTPAQSPAPLQSVLDSGAVQTLGPCLRDIIGLSGIQTDLSGLQWPVTTSSSLAMRIVTVSLDSWPGLLTRNHFDRLSMQKMDWIARVWSWISNILIANS